MKLKVLEHFKCAGRYFKVGEEYLDSDEALAPYLNELLFKHLVCLMVQDEKPEISSSSVEEELTTALVSKPSKKKK